MEHKIQCWFEPGLLLFRSEAVGVDICAVTFASKDLTGLRCDERQRVAIANRSLFFRCRIRGGCVVLVDPLHLPNLLCKLTLLNLLPTPLMSHLLQLTSSL